MLEELKEFARDRVACHPGLFHPQVFPTNLFREMAERGLSGASDPGSIANGQAILAGETGSLGFALAWAGRSLVPLVLDKLAGLPEGIKAGVRRGEIILALAVSEPGAGAHPKYLATTATSIPGGWRLDGEKAYVTNGPIASHLAVLAITSITGGRKAFSFFLVPVDAHGLTIVEQAQFDYLRPAQHCGFRLEDCEVPECALIGRAGKGYEDIARPFRNLEDAVNASGLLGVLAYAGRRAASILAPAATDEAYLALGELAGLETALEALNEPLIAALETWDTETDAVSLRLIAMRDLAKRYVEILRGLGVIGDESIARIANDAIQYLEIARTAHRVSKMRLGLAYFTSATGFAGKPMD